MHPPSRPVLPRRRATSPEPPLQGLPISTQRPCRRAAPPPTSRTNSRERTVRERGKSETRSCKKPQKPDHPPRASRVGQSIKPFPSLKTPKATDIGQVGTVVINRPSQRAEQSVRRTSTTGSGTSTIESRGDGDGLQGTQKARGSGEAPSSSTWKSRGGDEKRERKREEPKSQVGCGGPSRNLQWRR